MSPELLAFGRDFGFAALLVLALLWHLRREHVRMASRLNNSEDWIRDTLAEMNAKTTHALRENSAAFRELIKLMSVRPCLRDNEPYYQPHPSSITDISQPKRYDTTQEIKR